MSTNQVTAALVVRRSMSLAQSMVEPYMAGTMNSLVRITRRGGWDPVLAEYSDDVVTVLYADDVDPSLGAKAGVAISTGPLSTTFGDEPESTDSISVYIPRSAPAAFQIDDLVQIMAGPDSSMIGRWFQVDSVPAGGRLMPSIRLECSGRAPDKSWTAP